MRSAGKTDVGLVRKINEDSFLCVNLSKQSKISVEDVYLFMVADGMGGANAGEVASSMAIEEIASYISRNIASAMQSADRKNSIQSMIRDAIAYTNDKIYKKSVLESNCFGMGTTLSLVLAVAENIYIGHIGDSRIYLIRDNSITRLTDDHSLVAELVKNGTIKPEDAQNHPQKNIITRALGTEYNIEADEKNICIKDGDYLVLCTDGLTNLLEDEEIMNIVIEEDETAAACDKLIKSAITKGGNDNITVVIIQIGKGGDADDR
ncbi:MAG: Stp1/IreP family PP2C-type Ser/Thr phosphatase [Bacillota bacterium]